MVDLTEIFMILGVILFSMVLHELAHGVVAYWLGDETAKEEGRLTLNPIKHLDPVMSLLLPLMLFISGGPVFGGAKPVPVNSRNLKYGVWGMALVALAGPMTNFILAFLGFVIGYFTGGWFSGGVWSVFFSQFVYINIGFGIFNLIPIPPLDGSRVLYAMAPDGVREVMVQAERYGLMIVLLLVVLFGGVFSKFMIAAMTAIINCFFFLVGA